MKKAELVYTGSVFINISKKETSILWWSASFERRNFFDCRKNLIFFKLLETVYDIGYTVKVNI
jgi:hypothetical protein